MILLLFISIVLLFLTGLLVLPIRLVLHSEQKKYFIEIPIYLRAQLVPDNQLFFLKLRVFYIPIKIYPFRNRNKALKSQTSRKKNKGISLNRRKMPTDLLRAFKIKKAYADLDTGDFPLNAQLIPVTHLVNNNSQIDLHINFENRNQLNIEIFTRLYKLVWAVIINKSKS